MGKINYQKHLTEWCTKYNVPSIPVFVKDVIQDNVLGVFYPDDYYIEVKKGTGLHVLKHEFFHYIIRLRDISSNLEENICEFAENADI